MKSLIVSASLFAFALSAMVVVPPPVSAASMTKGGVTVTPTPTSKPTATPTATPTPTPGVTACQPIYGNGETCVETLAISLNKTVQNPQKGAISAFVDNLGVNDPKYGPDTQVNFKIAVTNNSNVAISNVKVTDTIPQYTTFVSGPGNFDSNSQTLTFTIDSLNSGETQTFDVTVKTVGSNALPNDNGITCVTNIAKATIESQTVQDTAGFCIQKQVLGGPVTKGGLPVFEAPKAKTVPPTGPEVFSLIGLIPAGLTGFLIRKKSILKR